MRKIIALVAAAAATAGAALVAATPAAADVAPGCYRPVYTHAVYRFTGDEDDNRILRPLSPTQFQTQCGGRAFVLTDAIVDPEDGLPVNEYYKYAFLPTIVGETFYGPSGPVSINSVPYDLWVAAGRPQPQIATSAQDLVYNLASDPSAIYLQVGDDAHRLTFAEWNSLGQPTPNTIGTIQRYPFSPYLFYVSYDSSGQPAQTYYLDGGDWASFGYPKPQTSNVIFDDLVFQFQGESAIYLRYPDKYTAFQLSFAEWNSIGQRAPVIYAPSTDSPTPTTAHRTPSPAAAKIVARHDLS